MLTLLRRVSSLSIALTASPNSYPSSLTKFIMDSKSSSSCFGNSPKLVALAQQLRLYKAPPGFDEADEEERVEDSARKVVSQVGFAESVTPVANHPERFRPKRAAVLICLYEAGDGDCDFRVILTKRSSRLSTHSGEVSLPGGKADEGDVDDADTAIREAREEIGLDPSLVNVVTVLEPFLSKHDPCVGRMCLTPVASCNITLASVILIPHTSRTSMSSLGNLSSEIEIPLSKHLLRVVPVIGILSDRKAFTATPNIAEVEAVFDAPLAMFLKDENRRSEEREWMGEKFLIHYFDYETDGNKYVIWGLTAGILIRAASVVYQRPPAFLEQNPKFKVPRHINKDNIMP